MITVLNDNANYWLVRTEGGIFYDQFVANNYIAIGWNEISDLDSFQTESEKENVLKLIREMVDKEEEKEDKPKGEREKEAKKSRIFNQINRFINEMKIGDIILIPSPGSNLIELGTITSETYIFKKNVVDMEEGECDFLKRRNVNWLYREKRDRLDPYLYRLIHSQHAISSANDYAHYIDRTVNKFYIKNNQAHLILEVGKESEIYGADFIQMMSSIFDLVDSFNLITESDYDKNSVQIKINVQSPGPIELFGSIGVIFAIGATIAGIIGGNFSILGLKIESPGLIEQIRKYRETKQNYDLEKEKLALQKMQLLQVKTPSELQEESSDKI